MEKAFHILMHRAKLDFKHPNGKYVQALKMSFFLYINYLTRKKDIYVDLKRIELQN